MDQPFYVSSSPHLSDRESIPKIMYAVVLSLLPAALGAIYFFGIRALWIMAISMAAAVLTEAIIQKAMKKPITVADGSALLTGMLLAFNVSAQVPLWIPVVGSVFAIAVGKQVFGGLGFNPMNPALLGRAFLLASWPSHMLVFDKVIPRGSAFNSVSGIDVITSATPLNVFKQVREILAHPDLYPTAKVTQADLAVHRLYDSLDTLFIGRIGGCLGETSVLLLLIGAAFLMYKRYIGWKIPFSYIGTVAVLSWIFGGTEGLFSGNILFHIFSGGLILGAFYMATDMVTSPVTYKGRIYFGIGCGVITVLIRLVGGYPEGVSYSILLMNLVVPLLDRYTRPKVFGGSKKQ
ncbi:RnfABCDGE type electron transport complex subunit D [candidate division KSB1 bacterium]|nr:RnfABCDGE type electron transport complex subunit D [candidate division KSB1 bacterium]